MPARPMLAILLLLTPVAVAQDTLRLRWGEPAPAGEVVGVGIEGVSVLGDDGVPVVIPWHKVRALPQRFEATATEFAEIREDAWRAAIRLRRGDRIAAEPLFEDLYTKYRDRSGPTAAFVARGLAACRIDAGEASAAVGPWLRSIGDTAQTSGERLLGEPTPLFADLAPFFAPGPPRITLREALENADRFGPAAGAFATAASADSSGLRFASTCLLASAADRERPRTAEDLLSAISLSRDADAATRAAARDTLKKWLDSSDRPVESWARVWCRLALGRSLVREPDPANRLAGALELLRIPAAEPDTIPRLTALALFEASRTLDDLGRNEESLAISRELRTRHADTPAARAYEQALRDPTMPAP